MRDIIIYGAAYGGTLKLIEAINHHQPAINVLGYVDDLKNGKEEAFMGYPVLGGCDALREYSQSSVEVLNNVYGTTAARKVIADRVQEAGFRLVTLIAPAVDQAYATIGCGCLVMSGVDIGVNVILKDHVSVKMNAVISHDSELDAYCFVGPGAVVCGHVHIGEGAYIGAGALIRERRRIGAWSTIGMGAVVTKDVARGTTVYGNPACEKA